jgi:3-hydroxyisobutyrate dehydrogenase-like beta-hydroxyacid dehydrogenase
MSDRPQADGRARWLIVGHGSVGASLAERLHAAGVDVTVVDPSPRLPVTTGEHVSTPGPAAFGYAISCVPPGAAEEVAPLAAAALSEGGLLFDWNTVAPAVKQRIAEATSASTVDVALLDSLDGGAGAPFLAVSGPDADRGAASLRRLGFDVDVVGSEVGQAATLKYLRSIFMKSLEALALEFASLASGFDGGGTVRKSIERNLGHRYDDFIDLLLATNRVHAARRAGELTDAVATFRAEGFELELADAAVQVLRRAAATWSSSAAPAEGADAAELADYLRRTLWAEAS